VTTNPNIEKRPDQLLASIDTEAEEITDEEWEEMETAYQDYVSGEDPGEPLSKVRQ